MKICYFGIYDPGFGRNKVYISGLRQNGVEVIECRDTSRGPLKFWRLWRKHAAIIRRAAGGPEKAYDALVVGYPGHIVVPFTKMLSRKPVVFDALCTLYEGEVISRGKYRRNPFMRLWIRIIDRMAAKRADIILVETDAQKEFFIKRFSLPAGKVFRVFTGADEEIVCPDPTIKKLARFTAVFRGKFLPEAGVKYIIRAAKLLESQNIDILILGHGFLEKEVAAEIDALKPSNLHWHRKYMEAPELYRRMQECHISLGQFEKHERLERTIPHKAFESLLLGLPYVTGRAAGIEELLTDGKDCLMTNLADPEDIAAKILMLKNDPQLAKDLAAAGKRLFEEKLTSKRLAQEIISVISA